MDEHWWREALAIADFHPDGSRMGIATAEPETRVKRLKDALRNLLHEDDGAALIEYALLLCLIAVVCVFFITSFGPKISNRFSEAAAVL